MRKFPLAALAALALIGVFETEFVWGKRQRIWDPNYILLEKKREALTARSPADDIAILGTSRFYHLKPQAIKQVAGADAKVTNYAWGWCSLEAYEGMLRGLLQADRPPKVVIVDSIPEVFAYQTKMLTIEEFDAFRIGFTETVPLGAAVSTTLHLGEWGTCWDILTHYMSPPSMLYREGIKRVYKTWRETGKIPKRPPEYKRLVDNWELEGWLMFVNPPDRVAPEQEFVDLEKATGPHVLRKNTAITRIYEHFLELAREKNIRVIMLPVANNPLAFQKFSDNGIYSAYDTWLDSLEQRFPNFSAPGPRYFTWPGLFGDPGHLNAAGVEKHMDLVVELLARELNNPKTE